MGAPMEMPVEDLEAIRGLTHEYAHLLDGKSLDQLVALYTEDGVWDASAMGMGVFEGREQIRGFFAATFEVTGALYHLVSNHLVTPRGPDAAQGRCSVLGWAALEGGRHRFDAGMYTDHYVRTPGGWRLRSRRLTPSPFRWPGPSPA